MRRIGGWLHVEPLLAVVLWGAIYPGAKLGLREIPVVSFAYLRIVLAAAVLFVVSELVQGCVLRRSPLQVAGAVLTFAGLWCAAD